jgi:hypothetical protein
LRSTLARLETRKNASLRTLERYAEGLDCHLEIDIVSADVKNRRLREAVG